MVIYLNDAMQQLVAKKGNSRETITKDDLKEYVIAGSAFFKQKTAYEMESRDWSSDVCSSD
eukprot:COSAG05_NODE_21572_length_271_cov_0.552326_1_plen_60_part_10